MDANAEPKHTPGKWGVFRETRSRVIVRAVLPREGAVLVDPAVCQVHAGAVGDSQAAANALLITAAPELLAVARAILARWELEPVTAVFPAHSERADLARAIAKAEGRA